MRQEIRNAAVAAIGVLLACSGATAAVSFNFETPGQYSANFTQVGGQLTAAQTSLGAANDYLRLIGSTAVQAQRAVPIYDATPGDGAATKSLFQAVPGGAGVTVSADVQFSANNASYGVYFVNGADRTKAVLALFNVNSSGALDNIRFTSATSAGWDPASNGNPTETNLSLTAASNADAGVNTGAFAPISVTYSINASNRIVLSMTAGSRTLVSAPITGTTAFSNVEVGFRLSPGGDAQTVDVDNVSIVPEPAALSLLGLAGLALVRRRHV